MILISLLMALLWASLASAQQLAFPSAEGYGRFATGGRQGYVCYVTSTGTGDIGSQVGAGPHHEGTLRYCLNLSGARNILFAVAGTINTTGIKLRILNGNATIAGQTAPGDGILLRGEGLESRSAHNIIRYFRSRPGNTSTDPGSNDALAVYSPTGFSSPNVIFDHCSVSWAIDENMGIWSEASDNITVQWSIISEALHCSTHPEGCHSKGLLAGGGADNVSVHHNIFAHNVDRNPNVSGVGIDVINNVIYHGNLTNVRDQAGPTQANVVGNYYKATTDTRPIRLVISFGLALSAYLDGNTHPTFCPDGTCSQTNMVFYSGDATSANLTGTRFSGPTYNSETDALTAYNEVRNQAGATKPVRDAVDVRIVNEVTNGGGGFINSPGTYPTYSGTPRDLDTYDTDRDGIPNAWETQCSDAIDAASTNHTGLSNSVNTDGALIVSSTGYSALEHYLNELTGVDGYEAGSCGGLLTEGGDATPPTVSISVPSAGAILAGNSETITATATDDSGTVTNVEFYANGSLIGSDNAGPPFSITLDTTMMSEGNKAITAIAYDPTGNPGNSAPVHVVVDNIAAYTAVHTATPPTIDGVLTEFAGANVETIFGTGTNETQFRFMWDADNLYLAAFTIDTELVATLTTHDVSNLWTDDGIELVIDTDNDNESDGGWDVNDYKIIVNLLETTYDREGLTDFTWEPGLTPQVAIVGTLNDGPGDTSWSIEMAIPWAELGLTPVADDIIGINIQINDLDTAGRTTYRWNGSINTIQDAMDVVLGQSEGGDTDPPFSVSITSPLNGAFVQTGHLITANASDGVGIKDVEFFEGTNSLCTDTASPFDCVWTQATEGAYVLKVRACDTATPENCTDSANVNATIDNTAPSTPTNLTLSPGYSDGEFTISANWDNSTDANGAPTYSIERCQNAGCGDFAEVATSLISDYSDPFLLEATTYCYRILALDAALNPSGYSDTECVLTLSDIGFIADGVINSISGLTALGFLSDGVIDSVSGLGLLPILSDGVIDSVSGLTGIGFIPDGQIDSVSIQ